jgi:hypothetical protein
MLEDVFGLFVDGSNDVYIGLDCVLASESADALIRALGATQGNIGDEAYVQGLASPGVYRP